KEKTLDHKKNVYMKITALMLAVNLLFTGCAAGNATGNLADDIATDMEEGSQDLDQMAEEIENEFEPSAAAERVGDQTFREYTDAYFRKEIVKNTINLHYTLAHPENYGITDYEVTLGDLTPEAMAESFDDLRILKADLAEFDYESLDEEEKLTYDILEDFVETELSAEDMIYYYEPLSAYGGYQVELPILLAEYIFRSERDVEDYLKILSLMDESFKEIVEYEKKKSEEGLFMADFLLDGILESCEDFIEVPEENYLLTTFEERMEKADFLTEQEKEAYIEENRACVMNDVIPAYEMLIKEMGALKGTGQNDKGMYYLEHGREYYEYLLRSNVGTDKSPEVLTEQTEKFIDNRFMNISKILQNDPSLFDQYETPEFPETEPEAIMEDLIARSAAVFPAPPNVTYEIKTVEPSMQEHLNPAFYLSPAIDDTENNTIYINPKYDDRSELYITLAHEGYPGHLYQMVSDVGNEHLPVRQLVGFKGYTEGWATYAENTMYRLSGMQENLALLLQYDNEYSLAVSAYADLRVNYYGWTREDLADYLTEIGGGDAETADAIFEVVVDMPGEYLNYFIGYLEFLDLRNAVNNTMDKDFDIREYHKKLISLGVAPFPIVREYMRKWAEEQ
ncbi:MAG: DUF885 domain-containing protein, partial [Lachnospiraceae bacterium]|nr:DUF885 domain-containing protein [Lachnospiraceae bacterium]